MALKLSHVEFKALVDNASGLDSYPCYIPIEADFPAVAYSMTGLKRDIQSNLKSSTVSMASYSVVVTAKQYGACHILSQQIIDALDQHSDSNFLLILVEDVEDYYDAELDLFFKTLTVTTRFRETGGN